MFMGFPFIYACVNAYIVSVFAQVGHSPTAVDSAFVEYNLTAFYLWNCDLFRLNWSISRSESTSTSSLRRKRKCRGPRCSWRRSTRNAICRSRMWNCRARPKTSRQRSAADFSCTRCVATSCYSTGSRRPHHCCLLVNKAENVDCMQVSACPSNPNISRVVCGFPPRGVHPPSAPKSNFPPFSLPSPSP